MMFLSSYRVTSLAPLVDLPLIISGAFFMMLGNDAGLAIFALAYILWRFLLLRCPRCRSLTWTRRFAKGKRGFFNQYLGLSNPERCNLCGLHLRSHSLWESIKWRGERYN